MAEIHCSILQTSNYILRERILSYLFEKQGVGSNKVYRGIQKIANLVQVYAIPPYKIDHNHEKIGLQIGTPINVAILLVSMDCGFVRPDVLISSVLNNEPSLMDDKIPVVVICTTEHADNNIGEKISLQNLSDENNRFLYVLPTMVLPNCIVKKLQNPSIDFNQPEVALFRQLFGPYFDICISIGMVLSPLYDLKYLRNHSPDFLNEILRQKYPSPNIGQRVEYRTPTIQSVSNNITKRLTKIPFPKKSIRKKVPEVCLIESKDEIIVSSICFTKNWMNISHLVSKMKLGWGVKRLIGSFTEADIFELFSETDTRHIQTPLMSAAIGSRDATLTAFLNFYSTSIKMSELNDDKYKDMKNRIDHLLHNPDIEGKTLVYYITHSEEKCLGPYGIIMQFELKFHVGDVAKEVELDAGYVDLNECLQNKLGSSRETSRALRLLNSTKDPSNSKLLTVICYSILSVLLFPMTLYIGDVVLDGMVAKNYHSLWKNGTMPETDCHNYLLVSPNLNTTTLEDYPTCLTYGWKLMYTVLFMAGPYIFLFYEILSNHFQRPMRKMGNMDWLVLILLPFSVVLWPCILLLLKTIQLIKYYKAKGHYKQKNRDKYEHFTQRFIAVHFCEVCIESSFNALLQWYILLPTFLVRYHKYETLSPEIEDTYFMITSTSFFFSIVSVAWSLTANTADQKKGALDMAWDPVPRMLLFLSNLFLVFSRINCLVIFMYYWGPGKFYPGMIAISLHVMIMMVIHFKSLAQIQDGKRTFRYLRHLFYVCFIHGFTNIMVNNFMKITLRADQELGKKPKNTRYRQFFTDTLFILENALFVSFGYGYGDTLMVYPLNQDVCKRLLFGIFILCCSVLGFLLKVIYYKFFHIWKELAISTHECKMKIRNVKWNRKNANQLQNKIEEIPLSSAQV